MNPRDEIVERPEWDKILAAAQKNNAQEIHNLINNHQVSPSHANPVGQSALHIACLWGNKEAVQALLSHGANVKAQNWITGATPLHICVQSSKLPPMNRVECAKMLFDYGADAHMKDWNELTALESLDEEVERFHGELEEDYVNSMRQTLEKGGRIGLKLIPFVENYDFDSLANYIQNHNKSDDETVLDVDERDPIKGGTALWMAIDSLVNSGNQSTLQVSTLLKIITLLLEKGSNPDVLPEKKISSDTSSQVLDSMTPIYLVCKALDQELVQGDNHADDLKYLKIEALKKVATLLKSCGATMTPCVSILHDAARRGHESILNFFVQMLGIDPNTKGRQGLTPLHFAARSGKENVVKLLLSFTSIDPTIVDDRGKTALDAAIANEKEAIVDLLTAYMTKPVLTT